MLRELGRIRYRLLIVNLVVVLVPAAGLEFARIYERQLLHGLERDMRNQALLVCALLETDLERGVALGAPEHERALARAATRTRTRIRVIEPELGVTADSHRKGPPEGPEPRPPILAGQGPLSVYRRGRSEGEVTPILDRPEVVRALAGIPDTATRVARDPPAVYLFHAEPLRSKGVVRAAVYVTRSTQPVLVELHRIREGLLWVLAVALGATALLTLGLALSISRPLERLARAARRITAGDFGVEVPVGGGGEIAELGREFAEMTRKLEARHRYISEFAADVAHEFKSPLTSIRGAAELLAEGAADDPDARRRFLENIRLDAARLDRLVSRLLELSRIDASEAPPAPVDLRALVQRAVLRAQGPEGNVVLDYESTIPVVLAREADLETALSNLLDNALRFSPPGEPVTVRVTGRAGDHEVAIAVSDRGPGIAPEHLPRIFERFFTTDGERDGTGLGLAIVASVADAHGGRIEVEAEPGKGARFTLHLPVGVASPRKRLAQLRRKRRSSDAMPGP